MTHSFPTRRSSDLLDLGQRAEQLIERLGDEHLRRAVAQRTRQPQPQMAIGIEPQRERRLARRVAPDAPLALARGFAPDPRRGGDRDRFARRAGGLRRSEEHTSELQSLMRISYAVFCLKKKKKQTVY